MTHTDPITIELKYCELCGGLFFRPQHTHYTLCSPCVRNPRFLLRDSAKTNAPDATPSTVESSAWYGPTTDTIHHLDAVSVKHNSVPAVPTCDLRLETVPGSPLTTFDVRPSTTALSGGAA